MDQHATDVLADLRLTMAVGCSKTSICRFIKAAFEARRREMLCISMAKSYLPPISQLPSSSGLYAWRSAKGNCV